MKFMSTALVALRDKPQAYFRMDTATPFPDISGYARASSMLSGTAGKSVSLGNGFDYSSFLSNLNVARFDSPVFVQGRESNGFTLEAIVRQVVTTGAEQKVLSHTSGYDGLLINGTKVTFVTKYLTTGEARAEYDIQIPRRVHLVGVHMYNKNLLYVDGELVASADISAAQQADQYIATDGKLYSGTSTTAQSFSVNGLAVYGKALTASAVKTHYLESVRTSGDDGIAEAYGGTGIPLSVDQSNLFIDHEFITSDDWLAGTITNLSLIDENIEPMLVSGTSIPGTWQYALDMDTRGVTSVYGVNITWDGMGAIVSASLDGVTWTTVTRGQNLSIVPNGFNPVGKTLFIKVAFPGGIVADPAFVDNLNVYGFITGAAAVIDGRTVTVTPTSYIKRGYDVVELRDDWGTELVTGTLTIGADSSTDAEPVRTVEIWVKPATTTLTVNVSGTTYYNGGNSAAIQAGQWQLIHIVGTADLTGALTITGAAQIGQVSVYPTALVAADVAAIYKAYMGVNMAQIIDTATISVTEPANATLVYSHDWAISSGV